MRKTLIITTGRGWTWRKTYSKYLIHKRKHIKNRKLIADEEDFQATAPQGAHDPPAPQNPLCPSNPQNPPTSSKPTNLIVLNAPQAPEAPEAPHLPTLHAPPLNWSHFKSNYSGKPDKDAEAHLFRANDWMDTHGF